MVKDYNAGAMCFVFVKSCMLNSKLLRFFEVAGMGIKVAVTECGPGQLLRGKGWDGVRMGTHCHLMSLCKLEVTFQEYCLHCSPISVPYMENCTFFGRTAEKPKNSLVFHGDVTLYM